MKRLNKKGTNVVSVGPVVVVEVLAVVLVEALVDVLVELELEAAGVESVKELDVVVMVVVVVALGVVVEL